MPTKVEKNKVEKKPRRSHAERSAETRARIIDAVAESIAELGFKKTTTATIAKKAGVTWGALQHHFGGMQGCLLAAFEESFQRFVKILGEPESRSAPIEKRVHVFLQRCWQHYSSDHYLVMFQVLLNDMPDIKDEHWLESQNQILHSMDELWQRFFSDVAPELEQRRIMARYTHSVLSGLAVTSHYGWKEDDMNLELSLLEKSLLSLMDQGKD
jgi:AcrR family transcriptional regulator